VLQGVSEILAQEFSYYKNDPFYYYASVQFQPLPRIFTQHSLERGGNVLGLDRYKDNNVCKYSSYLGQRCNKAIKGLTMVVFLLDLAWKGSQLDARIRGVADQVMTNVTTYLHSVGALKDFQYINYAFQDQDPLGGYGKTALSKIKAASQKYDPGQVFQKLVPGGFKLANAGKGTPIGLP